MCVWRGGGRVWFCSRLGPSSHYAPCQVQSLKLQGWIFTSRCCVAWAPVITSIYFNVICVGRSLSGCIKKNKKKRQSDLHWPFRPTDGPDDKHHSFFNRCNSNKEQEETQPTLLAKWKADMFFLQQTSNKYISNRRKFERTDGQMCLVQSPSCHIVAHPTGLIDMEQKICGLIRQHIFNYW